MWDIPILTNGSIPTHHENLITNEDQNKVPPIAPQFRKLHKVEDEKILPVIKKPTQNDIIPKTPAKLPQQANSVQIAPQISPQIPIKISDNSNQKIPDKINAAEQQKYPIKPKFEYQTFLSSKRGSSENTQDDIQKAIELSRKCKKIEVESNPKVRYFVDEKIQYNNILFIKDKGFYCDNDVNEIMQRIPEIVKYKPFFEYVEVNQIAYKINEAVKNSLVRKNENEADTSSLFRVVLAQIILYLRDKSAFFLQVSIDAEQGISSPNGKKLRPDYILKDDGKKITLLVIEIKFNKKLQFEGLKQHFDQLITVYNDSIVEIIGIPMSFQKIV